MTRAEAPPPLVDRTDEFALLMERVDHAIESGRSSVVVLRGEAGVGKTRLLANFAFHAAERYGEAGLLAGYGQAMLNSLASDSFQAVRECLRSLTVAVERSGSRERLDRVARSFRQNAPDWVQSVPVVGQLLAASVKTGQAYAASGPETLEMDSRLDQLLGFIEDVLTESPLLMVLDDLHWADTATIDLLTTIALRVRGPLVLVLAYRPDQLRSEDQSHPLQRAVFRLCRYLPDTAMVDLQRLSAGDTEVLVRRAAGSSGASMHEVARIVRLSAGNPLFAESLVRLDDRGRASAPRQITAVLEERLSYLSGTDQRLLETAALIGFSFEVDYLARLAREDLDDVYERLHVLFDEHGLVRPADPRGGYDRYIIHHPLFAQILRDRGAANAPRWRRQHARLLEILETEPNWDDELQVRAAAVAVAAEKRSKAGALALEAARRQYTLGAVSKARDLSRIAVEQTPSFQAYALLAECQSAEGDHVASTDACAAALACASTEPVAATLDAQVRLLWARNLRMTCHWDDTDRVLNELLAVHPESDPVHAEAMILKAEIALCGPVQNTARCIELCDAVSAMSSDPEVQSRAYGHRGLAHLAAYDASGAEQWLAKSIDVARANGHPYAEYEALHWLSKKTMACLELDRSWELLEQLARMSQTSGVASENPPHLRDSSRVLGLQLRFDEAADAFARFADVSRPSATGRVAATLALQVRELEDIHGRIAGQRMLNELQRNCGDELLSAERRTRLAEYIRALGDRPADWNPALFAMVELGVTPDDTNAADAIFRFDVPRLSHLRAGLPGE
ncbi:AAA family ATPase [Nocardia sp. NPDC051832]|uniref:ATP-binding protein n=1 Tax=Nocardia sp. NPDC051832 TaxID=3155673 RepID=UPI00342F6F64